MSGTSAPIFRYAAIITGLALLFTWFGVYNTGQMAFGPRLALWTTTITVGVLTSLVIIPAVFHERFAGLHIAFQIILAAVGVSVPVTASLMLIQHFALGQTLALTDWPLQFVYVLAVSVVITAGFAFAEIFQKTIATSATPAPGRSAPAIVDRLPVRLRSAEIYAVSSEDHYLRVHTSAGEELILLRLSDALRELDGIEGLQTHRSWWVARDGLAETQRANGKLVLKLKSGAEAPVSRTYRKSVQNAGWA